MRLIFLSIYLLTTCAYANEIYFHSIVQAIGKAEGNGKTRHPYGIVSVKVKDIHEAKQVCFNTVRNNFRRWKQSGCKKDFIDYLGDVYCPIGANNDPKNLNRYWKDNVRFFLQKDTKYSILNEQRLKRQG